jgi:hypothetical protein
MHSTRVVSVSHGVKALVVMVAAGAVVGGCAVTAPGPSMSPAGSPTPSASASPAAIQLSPSPTDALSPIVPAWSRAGGIAGVSPFWGKLVIGFEDGYVAVAMSADTEQPTAWFSADGQGWAPVTLSGPGPRANTWTEAAAIATSGRTVVVVGGYSHRPCVDRDEGGGPACIRSPISWASDDGTTWRSSMPWVGPLGKGEGFDQGSEFSEVWAVPDGWEAALFYWQGEATYQREIWHSTDGVTWAPQATVFAPGEWDFHRLGLANAEGRRVVASNLFECPEEGPCTSWVRLWTSDDGMTWRELAPPAEAAAITGGQPGGTGGAPWLLGGKVMDAASGRTRPALWSSVDLAAWQLLELPGASGLESYGAFVTSSDGAYVAIAYDEESEHDITATWWSPDGLAWVGLTDPPVVQALADGPAGVIGLGMPEARGTMPVVILPGRPPG